LKVQGVKLRVFEDQGGYFKTTGSLGGSCEIIPYIFTKQEEFSMYWICFHNDGEQRIDS
jgi:hypothetical protein